MIMLLKMTMTMISLIIMMMVVVLVIMMIFFVSIEAYQLFSHPKPGVQKPLNRDNKTWSMTMTTTMMKNMKEKMAILAMIIMMMMVMMITDQNGEVNLGNREYLVPR